MVSVVKGPPGAAVNFAVSNHWAIIQLICRHLRSFPWLGQKIIALYESGASDLGMIGLDAMRDQAMQKGGTLNRPGKGANKHYKMLKEHLKKQAAHSDPPPRGEKSASKRKRGTSLW